VKADRRRQHILEVVAAEGRASIAALAQSLNVSEMTIRRDLTDLDAVGALARVHGGAVIPSGSSHEPPFGARARLNSTAKAAIAIEVARLIEDDATVFLDGGSTGVAIAQALASRAMTICTPSLRVADALKSAGRVRLMMTGGVMRPREHSFVGPSAIGMIGDHRFDWYVMTVSGIDLDAGCTEWNLDDAAVKQAALASAREAIVAADASKIGAIAFGRICGLERVGSVVTEADPPRDFVDGLRRRGVRLQVPPPPP
jgi:DeoR/GlpR family transcriptional regulator of sugar metabolism